MSKPTAIWDIEIYRNYFLLAFMNAETGRVTTFEACDDKTLVKEDQEKIRKILDAYTLVGFNTHNFDLPILSAALAGHTPAKLKEICYAIIVHSRKPFQIEQQFKIQLLKPKSSIDLIEVAPGIASLKLYAGRMHAPRMQDLPIEPDAVITESDRQALREYCTNDLNATLMLYQKLQPQIALRVEMGKVYGLDLRSKSDAQIAEVVIKKQVEELSGAQVYRHEVDHKFSAKFTCPDFIQKTKSLAPIIDMLESQTFYVNDSGSVIEPEALKGLDVKIGNSAYRMGVGGLHSSEKKVSHYADAETLLIDRDVASYYPNIILGSKLAPENMTDHFQTIYQKILDDRLAAKNSGDSVTSNTLKIVLNGSFGKLGSKWSILYAPRLLLQVTLTGQLALLMLIEMIEDAGIPVVSANTDGIVIKCPGNRKSELDNIVGAWEIATGFDTEETFYKSIHSRDVNNYVAIKRDGGFKSKGVYAPAGLSKNPTTEICVGAVVKYLMDGTPIAETIFDCDDIKKFVTIRKVDGGALDQDGAYLGKAIRWYYASDITAPLTYQRNGNKVPATDGACALMQLPDEWPSNLDYRWYVEKSKAMLLEMGVTANA
jgi:DNA polymerase elongation subunit (family B)